MLASARLSCICCYYICMMTGRSDTERPEARAISDTSVNTDHSPLTVDRLGLHVDESRDRTSPVTSRSSSSTSPDCWLSYYSRHHSMPAVRTASAPPPPPYVSGANDRLQRSVNTIDDDDDAQSTVGSDSSTPEPPLSARPTNLNNHPKILKDQLHHSMSSSLRPTRDVKFLNRSWTFAGR